MPNQQANASATTSNPNIPPYGVSEEMMKYQLVEPTKALHVLQQSSTYFLS